jgi:hypothetical protein
MKLQILFHRVAVAATVAALLCLSPAHAADGRNDKEKAAIAVLRSDAAEADKALACKQLAIFGSADAVPDLAKLLDNERLHSWARTGRPPRGRRNALRPIARRHDQFDRRSQGCRCPAGAHATARRP